MACQLPMALLLQPAVAVASTAASRRPRGSLVGRYARPHQRRPIPSPPGSRSTLIWRVTTQLGAPLPRPPLPYCIASCTAPTHPMLAHPRLPEATTHPFYLTAAATASTPSTTARCSRGGSAPSARSTRPFGGGEAPRPEDWPRRCPPLAAFGRGCGGKAPCIRL